MNKNIQPYNANGQQHGYWESYWGNGQLFYKCVFINGKVNGFAEYYWGEGKINYKNYCL